MKEGMSQEEFDALADAGVIRMKFASAKALRRVLVNGATLRSAAEEFGVTVEAIKQARRRMEAAKEAFGKHAEVCDNVPAEKLEWLARAPLHTQIAWILTSHGPLTPAVIADGLGAVGASQLTGKEIADALLDTPASIVTAYRLPPGFSSSVTAVISAEGLTQSFPSCANQARASLWGPGPMAARHVAAARPGQGQVAGPRHVTGAMRGPIYCPTAGPTMRQGAGDASRIQSVGVRC